MPEQSSSRNSLNFIYWGTLISSIGTYVFPGATVGVLTQLGYPLWQIGFVMGISRFGTIAGSFLFGDLAEKYDPKKVIIGIEATAFAVSCLLVFSWTSSNEFFWFFCLLVFLRFFIISIGGPSRNRMVKDLSDEYRRNHFHSAVILNVVTYGPGVVGSFLGYIAIKYLSYSWALLFDAATFLLGGYLIFQFVNTQIEQRSASNQNFLEKIRIYFSHRRLAILDILLALPFMGTNVLMSRLSDGVGYRVPILLMTFGLAVFISAPLLKYFRSAFASIFFYGLLLTSFIIIGIFHDSFPAVILGVSLRNISYWYLFNLYTGTFQELESNKTVASLFSARALILTTIIATGEFVFGSFGELFSINFDICLRILFTLLALGFAIQFQSLWHKDADSRA